MAIKEGAGAYGVVKEFLEQASEEFKGKRLEQNTQEFRKSLKHVLKPIKKAAKRIAEECDNLTT